MTNRLKLVLLVILLLCIKAQAQTFYVSAPINPNYSPGGSYVYKVDLTPSGLVSTKVATCSPGDQFFSIAMNKTGFYWVNSSFLFKGDIVGDVLTNCSPLIATPQNSNALTIGSDGKIYYSGSYLFATDLTTSSTKNLGAMSYYPTGDLCFYDGNLYMSATQGLIKIDTKDPSKSTVHIPLPSTINLFGLVTVATSLHKNTVYGFSYVSPVRTDVIEFDLDNKKVVGLVGTLPYSTLDAASIVEDGSILGIELDKIDINQDCTSADKAIIDVITKPHIEDFVYKLNGITNTTGKFIGIPQGTYTLEITSASDAITSTVNVPAFNLLKPEYSWKVKNQLCESLGEITFSTSELNSSYQIKYEGSFFPLNNSFTGLTAGKSYHFEIVNKYGCKVDEVDASVAKDKCAILVDQIQIQQQCDAFNMGLVTVLTKPHKSAYTYTINNLETNTTGIFKNLNPGSYKTKITSDEDEIEIAFVVPDYKLTQPNITFDKKNPACATKGNIKFSIAANNALYKIQYKGNLFPIDYLFDNLDVGKHHFVIMTQAGCLLDQFDVDLVYEACPIIIEDVQIAAECNTLGKGLIKVIAPPIPETYTYILDNSITNTTGQFNMLNPGTYQIKVTASGGGTPAIKTINVPDYSLLKPQTIVNIANPVCDIKGKISFSVGDAPENYSIQYGSQIYESSHLFINLNPGFYHFSILKKDGCIADALDLELVEEQCNDVSFPSAFSPNFDGTNDDFKANAGSRAFNYKMQIFDRRGVLIFNTNQLYNSWNGDYNGKPMPTATYFWIASFTTQENKLITKKGSITLIR